MCIQTRNFDFSDLVCTEKCPQIGLKRGFFSTEVLMVYFCTYALWGVSVSSFSLNGKENNMKLSRHSKGWNGQTCNKADILIASIHISRKNCAEIRIFKLFKSNCKIAYSNYWNFYRVKNYISLAIWQSWREYASMIPYNIFIAMQKVYKK